MNKEIDKLTSVKEAFTHWRTTRTKQNKIPDYLWEQVKGLLNYYTLGKICSTLNISTVQIRNKLIPEDDVAIQFVEIKERLPMVPMPDQSEQSDVCAIELHRPCGSIFKVNTMPLSLVSQLIVNFMG